MSYQFICPSTYIHDGKKVLRNSLKAEDISNYDAGTGDVWVFEPEFIVEQILVYRGMAERNMNIPIVAEAVDERVRMKCHLNGIKFHKVPTAHEAVKATKKACAAAAEVDAAADADDLVWKAAADEYDRLGVAAVQLFEDLLCMNRISHEDVD